MTGKNYPSETTTVFVPISKLIRGTIFAGRYEIIEELGKGGMGKVYRVLDRKIDEEVALKLLSPEYFHQEDAIARFRDELKLARKITQKNVCRMYHLEEEEGSYYITMEYIPGENLKDLIKREKRLPVKRAIFLAKQFCEGLAEAHRLDVIHRDLKSKNIMIDTDGNVRILDFGIAFSLREGDETTEGILIGSPHYMSPEQAAGEVSGPRSDIYSLGVILYEMVTGRLPFEGETALALIRKHKTELPSDPRDHNDLLPEDLSRVILKCLEKEKERRYQTAEDILSELEKIERGIPVVIEPERSHLPSFLIGEKMERISHEKPVFVARDKELAVLKEHLASAVDGRGRVTFVTGEAGSGKTTLIHEFAHRVQGEYNELVFSFGNCNAHTGLGDAYLPFREILNVLTCDIERKWTTGTITQEHAIRLWNLLPFSGSAIADSGPDLIENFVSGDRLLEHVGALRPRRPELRERIAKLIERRSEGSAPLTLQQSDLFEQYTRVLLSMSRQKPLLLLLDDLQWADTGSLYLLGHFGRLIRGNRILIIGAFRPAEVAQGRNGEQHPLEPLIYEFQKDTDNLKLELGQIGDREFVEEFLNTEPNLLGPGFREILYRQTMGNPLFTIELLRNMQEKEMIVPNREGKWVETPSLDWDSLPARIDAVVEERINKLPVHLQDLLVLASVEGEEFTGEVIARLKKKESLDVVKLLSRELEKRYRIIVPMGIRKVKGRRLSLFRFRHILFQKYLYNRISRAERCYLHEEVGTALEKLYSGNTEKIAVQLARHFGEAGNAAKEMEYLEKAGERAARAYAHKEAVEFFTRVSELGSEKDAPRDRRRQANWEQRLGEAYLGMGKIPESRMYLMRALANLDRPVPVKKWRLTAGILRELLRQVAHRIYPAIFIGRSRKARPILLQTVRTYDYITEIGYLSQEKILALYTTFCSLNIAERAGPSPELARVYVHLGLGAGVYSLHSLAERYIRYALDTAYSVDSLHSIGYISMITATYYLGVGKWQKAEDAINKAAELYHRTGDWRRWEQIFSTGGHLSYYRGKFKKSMRSYENLYNLAVDRGDPLHRYWGLTGMAMNKLRLGMTDDALENLEKIDIDELQDVHRAEKISIFAFSALAHFFRNEHRLALRFADQASELFSQSDPRMATMKAYLCVAEVIFPLWEACLHKVESDEKILSELVKKLLSVYHKYAKVFPIAQPGYSVWWGLYLWLTNKQKKAWKVWKEGLALAERLGMPYERGMFHYEMGRHSAGPDREHHLKMAQKIFSRMGTTHNLTCTEAELDR